MRSHKSVRQPCFQNIYLRRHGEAHVTATSRLVEASLYQMLVSVLPLSIRLSYHRATMMFLFWHAAFCERSGHRLVPDLKPVDFLDGVKKWENHLQDCNGSKTIDRRCCVGNVAPKETAVWRQRGVVPDTTPRHITSTILWLISKTFLKQVDSSQTQVENRIQQNWLISYSAKRNTIIILCS